MTKARASVLLNGNARLLTYRVLYRTNLSYRRLPADSCILILQFFFVT